MLVRNLAQARQELTAGSAHAALALYGLYHDGRRVVANQCPHGIQIAELGAVKSIHMGGIALAVLFAVARHNGGERAPMEGAIEHDGAPPIGLPADIEIAARELQRAL